MGNERGKFVSYIVLKYLENLCEFMQIYLNRDTSLNEMSLEAEQMWCHNELYGIWCC